MNSDTVAHIQAEMGGGFRGALREDPMLLWLEKEHVRHLTFRSFRLSHHDSVVSEY
jgi:hypothetical protein